MMTRPSRALYDAVNLLAAEAVAERLSLAKARERGKYACVACQSSDGLHAYRGDGKGFFCFACGTAFSNVDAALNAWGLDHADACQRLADAFGLSATAGSAPLRYVPPPASRPVKRAAPPVTYPALERVRAEGRVPQLPPSVYGAILDALTLTADGAAYLRSRGLDDAAARDYGFRSIDGAREWATLGDGLATEFCADELEAANLYRVRDDDAPGTPATWAPPWGGHAPALLMPYTLAGEVVAIQLRDLRPATDKKLRYRALIPTGAPRPPFNADAIAECAGDILHVTEGELNAFTLMQAGARAVGLKAAVWPDEWTVRVRDVRRLVVWFDLDAGSEKKALNLGGMLQATLGSSWVSERTRRVPLPIVEGKNLDANDLHLRGILRDYLARAAT